MEYPDPDWSEEFALIPHPAFPPPPGVTVSVFVDRRGGALEFAYFLHGDHDDDLVEITYYDRKGRTDELWKHTCFEAFLRIDGQTSYSELNFAPWGQWAAYAFDDYRAGMRNLTGASEPFAWSGYKGIGENDSYGWSYGTIEAFDPAADWHLNLTAVIEAKDGTKSYWALAHAPGPPDFHNPDCFIATLPAPSAP